MKKLTIDQSDLRTLKAVLSFGAVHEIASKPFKTLDRPRLNGWIEVQREYQMASYGLTREWVLTDAGRARLAILKTTQSVSTSTCGTESEARSAPNPPTEMTS